MIRYLRYVILAAVAIVLLSVALANRAPVTLNTLTPDMGAFLGLTWSVTLSLYLVIFGSIVVGLMLGFVWEWLRERKHRSSARERAREITRLERELAELRAIQPDPTDEVLTLLDRPTKVG